MPGEAPVPRPETLALNAFIHAVLRHSGIERRSSAAGNTLFLAIGLQAIPATLVYDALLDPVDKIVWQVIFQAGVEDGGCGAFPSYKSINAAANLGSSATVSRALAMLRLTRWMTCVTHDQLPQHAVSRSVQVLHRAPLPMADTFFLDPGYVDYVAKSRTHHHAKVRTLAATVHDALNRGLHTLDGCDTVDDRSIPDDKLAMKLRSSGAVDRVTATVQESKSCSSKQQDLKTVKKTTTTPTEQHDHYLAREAVVLEKLILPARLKPAQHSIVARYLANVPDRDRQAVLDELAGRLGAEHHGAKPVYDVLRYLNGLCQRARGGDFVPNLGVAIRQARDQRQSDANPGSLPPSQPSAPVDREAGLRVLAELRASLGMSFRMNSVSNPEDSSR